MPVSGMTRGRVQPIALPQNETSYKFSLHICPIPRITSWLTRHTARRRARLRAPASGEAASLEVKLGGDEVQQSTDTCCELRDRRRDAAARVNVCGLANALDHVRSEAKEVSAPAGAGGCDWANGEGGEGGGVG